MGYTNNSGTSTADTSNIDDSSSSQSSTDPHIISDNETSSVSSIRQTNIVLPTSYKYPTEYDDHVLIPNIEYDVPDRYGQIHPIETEDLIQNTLRDFDNVLNHHIPVMKTKHVNDARCKCPELLTDSFKLMFLRCECFKVDV
jgi:hypothetical protein